MHNEDGAMHRAEASEKDAREQFEQSDLRPKLVFASAIVLAVVVASAYFIGVWVTKSLRARTPIVAEYEAPAIAQEGRAGWQSPVRLQDDPGAFLRRYEQDASRSLHSFGVVSDDPAIYHIPITDAIDLVVNQGFPEFNALGPLESSGQDE